MERQIRRLAIGFLLLFAALAVNINYIQVIAADDLYNNDANLKRQLIDEYDVHRGAILAADGQTQLALSVPTGGQLRFLRRYPGGELYGHVTGFYSIVSGRSELEEEYNDYLAGRAEELFPQRLVDEILGRDKQGASIVTTIDPELQELAEQTLGQQATAGGALAAINPQTGDVLALVSIPSFDPGPLASHQPDVARRAYQQLQPTSLDTPLLSNANDRLVPPGSTFKVVTAAAVLENGGSPDSSVPNPPQLTLPDSPGNPLENFGGSQCPAGSQIDLALSLQISCNVAFGEFGISVGGEALAEQSERFGFGGDIGFDIPFAEGQIFSEGGVEDAEVLASAPSFEAKTAIGQQDVRTNPLHMALVAGAIGNGGVMMQPNLVTEIRDPEGRDFLTFGPEVYDRVMSAQNAAALTQMMTSVVESGTGTAAQIPGVTVAGKTGTAQTVTGASPHAWFIAFAPAQNPQIAVAVLILNGGSLAREATGGELAAPVAKAVMEAALNR
jgi:peptidoglycan glycosyltransferase